MTDFSRAEGRTERLLLRPYRDSDLPAFTDLHTREDVARYLPWETRDELACRAALARHDSLELARDDDVITLAGFDVETGRLAAELVLFLRSVEHRGGEIGYVVHPDFQGRGVASEGARALLQIAFDVLGMHRVVARIDARNTASAAVAKRIGMRHEALLVKNEWFKGEWSDEAQYALLEEEWADRGTRTLIALDGVTRADATADHSAGPPA